MIKRRLFALIITALFLAMPFAILGDGVTTTTGILYTEPIRSVLFTHQSHLVKKLSCYQCHNGLFDMESMKVQEKKDFNMESLYKGRYCGVCHNGKAAFSSDTQCARCHVRVKGKGFPRDVPVYKTSVIFGKGKQGVRLNHEIHTQNMKCTACHPRLFKVKKSAVAITRDDHGKRRYCFICHDGKKAFSSNDCTRCHTQMPTMTIKHKNNTLTCETCHQTKIPTTSATQTACIKCHGEIVKIPVREIAQGNKVIKINVHDSHYGEIDCLACHKIHGKGKLMCNECHTFDIIVK